MKIKSLIMFSIVTFVLLSNTKTLSANWYAGSQRYEANGVWANIDTPYNLDMVTIDQSGESNWVSTYYSDQYGRSWIQTGWKFFYWYSKIAQIALFPYHARVQLQFPGRYKLAAGKPAAQLTQQHIIAQALLKIAGGITGTR